MSRNSMVDYMDVTGFLPRIERYQAVCWKGEQLYIKGEPCYQGAPRYLNEAETREYMVSRFGFNEGAMALKHFDYSVTDEVAQVQRDRLTISVGGRFIYMEGTPINKTPGGMKEEVVMKPAMKSNGVKTIDEVISVKSFILKGKELPVTQDSGIGTVGGPKSAARIGMGGILLLGVVALGWLLFGGKGGKI